MAWTWKCDICRARKIKCDQSRPICAQCSIKGRPCSYTGERSVDGAALSLVATKPQPAGAFHTLALRGVGAKRRKQPIVEPQKPLFDGSTRLALRWIHMFGNTSTEASSFGIFGTLLTLVPARIGSHPALDFATAYVIQSHASYKVAGNPKADEPTRLRTQALASLRKGLTAPVSVSNSDGLLVSMALHIVAEYLRGSLGGPVHYIHVGAMCELLRNRWTEGRFDELDSALIRAISGEEVLRAIYSGTPSVLEDVPELYMPSFDHSSDFLDPKIASDVILSQFCRLPRLISLVRSCVKQPDDVSLAENALANAKRLYEFRIEPLPFNSIERSTKDVEFMLDFDMGLDTWLDFESVYEFVLTLRYYTIRALICGLIERLAQVGVTTCHDFNIQAVQYEEIDAAESIARCCRYALNPAWDPAWPALRLPSALKICYGIWNRVEQRCTLWDGAKMSRQRARATLMKDVCTRISAHIGRVWYGWNMYPQIKEFSETCVGGPRLGDLGNPACWQVKNGGGQNILDVKP